MNTAKTVDPLTVSIIEHRLASVVEQIGTRIMKSCYSLATAHIRDLGIALFDRNERLISHGDWMPAHCAGSNIALKGMLDYIRRDNIHRGDFIIGNDYFTVRNGHLPDWSFVRPIFYKGELAFYVYVRTHQYDGGGAYPAAYFPRSYDCHAEGLIIPPTKVIDRGKINEAVYDIILHNVRGAPMVRMDNMIINASIKLAEETIGAICSDYGVDTVRATADQFISATEKVVRQTIAKWPRGVYRSERAADWDGTIDRPVWVRLALTIKPDNGELIFDYSDSDKQVDFVNSPLGNTYYATIAPLLWVLPPEMPRNQGLYNCVTIIVKEGTLLAPKYPATCAAQALAVGEEIIECVLVALGQAIPKDVPALWSRHLCPSLNGKHPRIIDPRTGGPQMYTVAGFTSDGSSGAIYGYDGWNGIAPAPTGGAVLKPPIEITERMAPWRWLYYEGITDSCGHGQFRGGLGTHCQYLNEHDPETYRYGDSHIQTGNSDGEKFTALGLLGGTEGKKNQMWIRRKGELIPLHTKEIVASEPGDVVISKSGGGGGVGPPKDRDIDTVRWDVLNEYVSVQTAREIYKVVIDPKTFEVDYGATAKLRQDAKL